MPTIEIEDIRVINFKARFDPIKPVTPVIKILFLFTLDTPIILQHKKSYSYT